MQCIRLVKTDIEESVEAEGETDPAQAAPSVQLDPVQGMTCRNHK